MSSRLSVSFMIKDLVYRNAMVVIFSAKHLPEVELEAMESTAVGENLYRVRTRLSNPRAVPTMSYLAQKINLIRKIYSGFPARGQIPSPVGF